MPAHARGPPPTGPAAWHNQAGYPSSSGGGNGIAQLPPPTGPSRGMPPQQPIPATLQPAASLPAATAAAIEAAPPIPDPPAIPTFSHIPYFTAIQLETLYARRRGARMSASTWLTNRDVATGFIQSVASRLGFPQRTIATAQQTYQRFHLFYPPSDFVLHEIAVASLFVAAKLNDTHKKPRDLLLASYALRFPQLVKGGGAASASGQDAAVAADEPAFPTLAGQKRKLGTSAGGGASSNGGDTSSPRPLAMAIGSVGEADIDPSILETDRKRLMALEKLILESLCFNFHSNASIALKMVIKLGRRSNLSRSFIRTAWKLAADLFRTAAPMQYPPNVIAVAALYAAALLARPPPRMGGATEQSEAATGQVEQDDVVVMFLSSIKAVSTTPAPQPTTTDADPATTTIPLSEPFPGCDASCHVYIEDVEEAVHELLDLYLACASQLPPSLYMPSAAHGGSAGATPSPLSPADPMDAYGASPASSGGLSDAQPAGARKKLKQYEYAPPPFGLVDWLNASRCAQLQGGQARKSNAGAQVKADATAPTKLLSTLLTDLKIYLRGLEYDRQRADDAFLAALGVAAETFVVPLPGVEGVDPAAAVAGVHAVFGGAAHSVAIELRPINDTGRPQSTDDILAGLDETQRLIVARIRRRKLAASLRITFVEPEIEKHPAAAHPLPVHQPAKDTPAPPEPKRTRIEQAKRYLF
ncbi:related to CTK2-beta subunit of C-terminal domain kinase I [Sporisorium reilianum f. sp. reilianum]|uniref:Related to CTK2-beta subunit of C-terminal domain kinase I n=1 Tax=Sporisorium reilianum f. sp. reilianum TaxID=72559 RepID=A0A2N8UIL3_9BASI|nr:related to CTK2-beta subunit of C-terminal domain kinase I [Sporisorium reilianum f. sp. reilianum]